MGPDLPPGALLIDYYKQVNVQETILKILGVWGKMFWVYYAY